MKTIINTLTGEYGVSAQTVRNANPRTIFPEPFELIEPFEWVEPADPPAHDPTTHRAQPAPPARVDGVYVQQWAVVELTPEDKDAQAAAALHDLESARAAAWAAIKGERDRRIQEGGYRVTVASTPRWFHSDTFSRTQQMGLVMMGANIPVGLQWKTMDGTFVAMTPQLAGQVFGAAATNDAAIFARAEQHRVAMQATAAPATYDYSTGWPPGFAGI